MLLWILAGAFCLLLLLFWPTARRRFDMHLRLAQVALKGRDWAGFSSQLACARKQAEAMKHAQVNAWANAECSLLAAQAAYQQGEVEEARAEASKAVDAIERAQAPDRHYKMMLTRQVWGDLCFDSGELDEAAVQFRAAVQAMEVTNQPAAAIFPLQRLSDVLLEKQDYDGARAVAERCVEFERKILASQGSAGPSISMTAPDLALASRDFERAETLFREKVDFWSRMANRSDNVDVTRYQFHLAAAQQSLGKLAEACSTLEKARDAAALEFGPQHPRVAKAQRKLDAVSALLAEHAA